jgi:hypothetical protein
LSGQFHSDAPSTERPIVCLLILLGAAFLVYLIAIRVSATAKQNRALLATIVVSSLAFRVTLLPSTPIQEIDIYRYLWDGIVVSHGISPFRYSPQQVRDASTEQPLEDDLARLVCYRDSNPVSRTILSHIHYPEVPTVYPPVSQVVFGAAALTTPRSATLQCRLIIMKIWLVAFDMLTLVLVVQLLRVAGRSIGLAVIYGWCPLLMKEVANSGHLDTIAVFFTTLSVYLVARLCLLSRAQRDEEWDRSKSCKAPVGPPRHIGPVPFFRMLPSGGAGVALALGVGAKLYPVVLAPLLAACVAKHAGWRACVGWIAVFVVTVTLVLWPMAPPIARSDTMVAIPTPTEESGTTQATPQAQVRDPSLGLKTFLRRWEMNDFIFLMLIENLKPADVIPTNQTAWFSITPESFREGLNKLVTEHLGTDDRWEASFLVARGVTALVFLVLVGWFTWRSSRSPHVSIWLEYAFLTLAWFWLLSPTQNPWYWTWVLPLLAFARSRVWLAMSGLVLLYYLRFWLSYHFPDTPVLGTPYDGVAFFDLVVTWIEYAPWLVCLCLFSKTVSNLAKPLSPHSTRHFS